MKFIQKLSQELITHSSLIFCVLILNKIKLNYSNDTEDYGSI